MISIIVTTRERFQMNPELKQQIIDIIKSNKPDGVVTRLKHIPELWNEIITNIPNLPYDNQAHKIYHYVNELAEIKKCPCGKPVSFQSLVLGYREFCSANCSFAKEAAKTRRIAKMQANGGVGLANPKTRAKQQNKVSNTINANQLSPSENHTDETIREKILEIFTKTPKQYSSVIKNDPVIWPWVLKNKKLQGNSDSIAAKIYSAYYNESDVCPKGNLKKFDRWSSGFMYCGHANSCECNKTLSAAKTSEFKLNYSEERKQEIKVLKEQTMIANYGVAYNFLRTDVLEKATKSPLNAEIYNKLINYDWLNTEYNIKKRSATDIANELNIYYSTVISYCRKHDFRIRKTTRYSLAERQVGYFLSEIGIEHETNDKSVLGNLEFDILIRHKNMAIEMNGLRWHSYHPTFKNPDGLKLEDSERHIQKTNLAREEGIFLFHVTDWEWENKRDIIKSQLRSKLGLSNRIYARQCEIKLVDSQQARDFLLENHLQGSFNSTHYIGLWYMNELVMLLTAGRHRFNGGNDVIEIHRLCSKLNTNVIGGGSRLVKYLKQLTNNAIIVSYCDIQKSDGKGYLKMGFTLIRQSEPGYFWTDMKNIIPRSRTTKEKLAKWLPNFNPEISEAENMWAQKYARYYDCGNFIFAI